MADQPDPELTRSFWAIVGRRNPADRFCGFRELLAKYPSPELCAAIQCRIAKYFRLEANPRQVRRAAQEYELVGKFNSPEATLYSHREAASCYRSLGDHHRMIHHMRAVVRSYPGTSHAASSATELYHYYCRTGSISKATRHFLSARYHLRKALSAERRSPNEFRIHLELARHLAELNELPALFESLWMARQAIESIPDEYQEMAFHDLIVSAEQHLPKKALDAILRVCPDAFVDTIELEVMPPAPLIDLALLKAHDLVPSGAKTVRLLGTCSLLRPVTVALSQVTPLAEWKIRQAGGTVLELSDTAPVSGREHG